MIINYFKIALRNMRRSPGQTCINIGGLAMGITCCLFITLFVTDELSYDSHHKNADRIFRLVTAYTTNNTVTNMAVSPSRHATTLLNEFQEIEQSVRLFRSKEPIIKSGENYFKETKFFFADTSVLDVFTLPLIAGNPETALKSPFSVVITETMARKYFPVKQVLANGLDYENPIGKTITYEDKFEFNITGVLQDTPFNSHFNIDFLASFVSLKEVLFDILGDNVLDDWQASIHYTYVLLKDKNTHISIEKQLPAYTRKYVRTNYMNNVAYSLQPIKEIHLHSDLSGEVQPNGNITYVYVFIAIAVLILLISCMNFTNLTIAKSTDRAKEVTMRKILGVERQQLIWQLLGESVLHSILAFMLVLLLVNSLLPFFEEFAGKQLSISNPLNGFSLTVLGLITLLTGVLAGSYPALFVSRFGIIETMKGVYKSGAKGVWLRKTLIVFQFIISVVLIISTIVVSKQLLFVKNKDLGFQKEQVVVLPFSPENRERYEVIKQEFQKVPNVLSATVSSVVPGKKALVQTCIPEGFQDDQKVFVPNILVDYDFLDTYKIELLEGRNFSRDFTTDATEAFILNESAVKAIGWDSGVGKKFRVNGRFVNHEGYVIGVVKDFHFESLHQTIRPLVLRIQPLWFKTLSLRIATGNVRETLAHVEKKWRELQSGHPFEYSFLDEDFNNLYRSEERLGRIFLYFAGLAILIACLGLFGLVSHISVQRQKEIGIRKVLGAPVRSLVFLLMSDFLKLVLIASVIGWPIAYFIMNKWLENFAYRTDIGIVIFLLASAVALFIAWLTVSYNSIKTALLNPIKPLRYE